MSLTNEVLLNLYRTMVRTRALDEIMISLVYAGKLDFFYHSSMGMEATSVGAVSCLRQDDYHLISGRYPGEILAKGVDPKTFIAEYRGRATGCCGGRSGYHVADPKIGIHGIGGMLGAIFPLALGLGLASKRLKADKVVMAVFGDGTLTRGTAHESMLMASNWKLPVVFVCQNNGIAVYTSSHDNWPIQNVSDMAATYAMPGITVDGQDVIAVYEAASEAVDRARRGDGPSLLECKTLRFRPHAEGLPEFRPPEVMEEMRKRDPIVLYREKLLAQGILTPEQVVKMEAEAKQEMTAAEKWADESPLPDPATLLEGIFVD